MLTEQQLDQFNTFGFLIFRQLFSPAELATIEVEPSPERLARWNPE